jgi:ABC-type dipeptide/oligopeptide/nickel transport system permease component
MGGYVVRRLMFLIPTLLVGTLLTFTLTFYGPGDPVYTFLGQRATAENVQALRHEWGLDRPFWVQYGDYMWHLAHGDLGRSILNNMAPITPLVLMTIPISAQLGIVCFILIVVFGVTLGTTAALNKNARVDYAIVAMCIVFSSMPIFVFAPLLMIVFTLGLHVIPDPIGWGGIFSSKIILPALSITLPGLLSICRLARAGVLEVLGQDYVRTARAKGLSHRMIILRHVLPNAITPVLTVSGPLFGDLFLGTYFVESIFAIPGFGQLGFTSLTGKDYPVIMAQTILGAAMTIMMYLIVDLLYGVLDPRVRLGARVAEDR